MNRTGSVPADARSALRRLSRRLRLLLEPPRRLHFRRAGGFLVFGALALGLATLNTGNNLLYLLLGALLGTIALSGWLSEQALREVQVRRTVPRAAVAGAPARIEYTVHNGKRRLPSHGLTVRELSRRPGAGSGAGPGDGGALSDYAAEPLEFGTAFVAVLEAGASVRARTEAATVRRGVYPLHGIALGTAFPFGLFEKERDVALPGALIVWPRTDRAVRAPRIGGRRGLRQHSGAGAAAGAERGDFRGLREYRPGDDPRDIHWRSTARRGEPILRQYDRDASDEYWIVLDTVAPSAELGEAAVEIAAALVAAAARRGDRFGLAAGDARLPAGSAAGRVDTGLDLLAAVRLAAAGPRPQPPAAPGACILVTARSAGTGGWGDIFPAGAEAP